MPYICYLCCLSFSENKTWSEIQTTGTPPAQRDKVGGVAIGTNIYYFGGFGPKSAEADLDIYDVRTHFFLTTSFIKYR